MKSVWESRWETVDFDDGGSIPWETFKVDKNLKSYVEKNKKNIKTAIDIGCGLGTNSVWMSEQGIKVTSIDLSERVINFCKKKYHNNDFFVLDFLSENSFILGNKYDLVFDRGCFHGLDFDSYHKFLKNVCKILSPNGIWFSLIGSDSGPYVRCGPPRKKASEISFFVEKYLEINMLRSCEITLFNDTCCSAWNLICKQKNINYI